MLSETEFAALGDRVVWLSFGIAIALGVVMARSRFCTMGAIADIVNMRDWARMRMWICAMGVAILGTQGLAAAGLLDVGLGCHQLDLHALAQAESGQRVGG